ncbi:MAG: HipA domain-containing protein [Solirubrobacteraceae bacterium]|nr:HipA domain-containing protein [Solirubrobacteraceae bacterium]
MPKAELGVWLDDVRVATLERRRWNDLRLRYSDQALSRWPRNAPIVSCSLPLDDRPQKATEFCVGLLPEGRALEALAARAGVSVTDTFELLARYGRDVAGALVFANAAIDRAAQSVEPYTPDSLAVAVGELADQPLGVQDDSELSIAGLQDKLLLVRAPDGSWGRPVHGAPSTHILKVEDRRWPGMAVAEGAALRLAEAIELTAIAPEVIDAGGIPCLVVRRFDRELGDGGAVQRLHQEDLCQALGRSPRGPGGRGKYEAFGGPGLLDLARLLDQYAVDGVAELERLLAAVVFGVAIGNADAHAKNLAVVHRTPTHVELAPLYDTVPTVLWPRLRDQLAMTVGGVTRASEVGRDALVKEATAWGLSRDRARSVIAATALALDAAVARGVVADVPALGEHVRFATRRLREGSVTS